MKTTVIIEMNNDGSYTAVLQHDFEIGFFGEGKTVEEEGRRGGEEVRKDME